MTYSFLHMDCIPVLFLMNQSSSSGKLWEALNSLKSRKADEGLTLEMSATHHIQQAQNMPYQPLLIKPVFSLLAHAEKTVFIKTSLPKSIKAAMVLRNRI